MQQLFDFEVRHPDYQTVTVASIGPDSASMQAAIERWGLSRSEWAGIAAYITARKLGVTLKPRCRRCGKEIERSVRAVEQGRMDRSDGQSKAPQQEGAGLAKVGGKPPRPRDVRGVTAPGLCESCAKAEAQYRREAARFRPQDRRAGCRETREA